ncbi:MULTISPECIES: tyrosine-type recombinase/integrase [unclassified Microbacterium]|uniref:tyrosine-type recombinase/integrase n=1 Tax=unclassified Microbacterium TaxID=2609290 RepID=UPI00301A241A
MGRTSAGVPARWAVLTDDDTLHPEFNRYLAYLENVGRSPNTVRAAAYDLRAYGEFLADVRLSLDDATNEVLAKFARWYTAPAENVTAVVDAEAVRERSTTNRALASIASFYSFLGSLAPGASGLKGYQQLSRTATTTKRPRLTVVDNVGRADRHRSKKVLGPRLRRRTKRTKVLSLEQVRQILGSCRDHRDRLFIMMAFTTGMRMGQILGLKHEDIDTISRTITVEAREANPNGARSKRHGVGQIPITHQLARLYTEYMHDQYGYIDSPWVFLDFRTLNPTTLRGGHAIVERLRRNSGLDAWSLHTLRHTFVTMSQKAGVRMEAISRLVLHANFATTVDMYSHLDVDDLRKALVDVGAWEGDI